MNARTVSCPVPAPLRRRCPVGHLAASREIAAPTPAVGRSPSGKDNVAERSCSFVSSMSVSQSRSPSGRLAARGSFRPCSTSNGFATTRRSPCRGAGQARRGAEDAQCTVDDLIARDEARRQHLVDLQTGAGAPQRRLEGDRQRHARQGQALADRLKAEVGDIKGFIQGGEAERTPRSTRRWTTRWR